MPQLGETVTEGTITKWLKAVGDTVARDEPLFEVSTDKVDSEVPSPAAGVLTAILVEEGDTVDVGATLAVIGDEAAASGQAVAAASESPGRAASVEDAIASLPDEPAVRPADEARSAAPPPPPPPPAAAPANGPTPSSTGAVLSPVVRKLLSENDLDPSSIDGTGLGGRITRSDVESAIASRGGSAPAALPGAPAAPAPPPPPPSPASPASPAPSPLGTEPSPVPSIVERAAPPPFAQTAVGEEPPGRGAVVRDEIVPFNNIRRRTAEHMTRSKATSPHTLMVREIDYERVERVRRAYGDRFREEEGFGLSYLPFAARATVEALDEYPHLNASVGDDSLIVHHGVNLGIAVDLDNQGLIVPVVHGAEELNLRGMARRIHDLADRARTKRLSLDDISGGTFSITNAGPFGTLLTGAIINQPQVAILSTDGVARKPVVVRLPDGGESIAIHSVGLVAMNFDHRAVDGAYVARFLARLAGILDDRDWVGEL
jgi:pyruvate/2-oxoglutarate dehydrogenase complex dihydrolipoamide acyltransferase (E2) component